MKHRSLALAGAVVTMLAILVSSVVAAAPAMSNPVAFDIAGVDLHDGMINQVGDTYYLYGTEYGCGYSWRQTNTPWCGFGVSTSTDKVHWTAPVLLFKPTDTDSWTNTTWASECGATGAGCFNPRMIQRTWGPEDGVWILWFNAPADYSRTHANAYYAMGCNGPTGPCGADVGAPYGTTHKPSLTICGGNGDFTIITHGSDLPVLVCTNADQTLSEEQISYWGVDGDSTGSTVLAGLTNVESPGAYLDTAHNLWIMTYSDPNCGYCEGTGTGYAIATSALGPWTAPGNAGWGAPGTGRRDLSATSCGGQPRTVSLIDGQPYQGIDLWTGTANETNATLHYEPLTYQPTTTGTWQPFTPWLCG